MTKSSSFGGDKKNLLFWRKENSSPFLRKNKKSNNTLYLSGKPWLTVLLVSILR